MKHIPVLIIGAGPVGLSLALSLARQNINSIVIERYSPITNHPRARGVNVRTMELFRQWGNATELLRHEQPKEARRMIWAASLKGEELIRISMDDISSNQFSPSDASFVSQDWVEESLISALKNYPDTDVQFLKEFISFEENEKGILVKILNKTNQQEEFIQAQYLIAADGAHSGIRKVLNIDMLGEANLGQFCSVYCEFDVSQWTAYRPCIGYFFTDRKIAGRFLASVDGKNRWIIGLRFGEKTVREDFTDEYCINVIREVVDLPDLPINIINKSFWTMAAQNANEYQKGKIFLVGDAAHRLPPTGGFGMNTGIQDAHNLAWKLAYVIKHKSPEILLETYHEERAPIAAQNIKWSTENAKRYGEIYEALYANDMERLKKILQEQQKTLNYTGLDLGFIYHSSAIYSENDLTISRSPSEYIPCTLPGIRAPHVSLVKQEETISTLDLFEKDFVLLIGSVGEEWRKVIKSHSSDSIKIYEISEKGDLQNPQHNFFNIYEMSEDGAVLVRPDGHVAWRSKAFSENAKDELKRYLQEWLI